MGKITLGGREFERRPLLVDDLFLVYGVPGLEDLPPAVYGQRLGLELLARSLVADPPISSAWLRNLPARDWRALMACVREVQTECGFVPKDEGAPPGEASSPVTT